MTPEHIIQQLRAATCDGCRANLPLTTVAGYPSHFFERDTAGGSLAGGWQICQSKHAELLLVVQAAVAAELRAAAGACKADPEDDEIGDCNAHCHEIDQDAILSRISPNAALALNAEIERAVQPLREALEAGMLLLDTIYPDDVFTGESGDEGALLVKDFRDAARAALRPQTVAEEL